MSNPNVTFITRMYWFNHYYVNKDYGLSLCYGNTPKKFGYNEAFSLSRALSEEAFCEIVNNITDEARGTLYNDDNIEYDCLLPDDVKEMFVF